MYDFGCGISTDARHGKVLTAYHAHILQFEKLSRPIGPRLMTAEPLCLNISKESLELGL